MFIELATQVKWSTDLALNEAGYADELKNFLHTHRIEDEPGKKAANLFDLYARTLELKLGEVSLNGNDVTAAYSDISLLIGNVRFWIKLIRKSTVPVVKRKKNSWPKNCPSLSPKQQNPEGPLSWDWRYGAPCYAILSLCTDDYYYDIKLADTWTEQDSTREPPFRIHLKGTDSYRLKRPVFDSAEREELEDHTWSTYIDVHWKTLTKAARKLAMKYSTNSGSRCTVL